MASPSITWSERPGDIETVRIVEPLIREYFAQDPVISSVTLTALVPGRSGAFPFTASLIGTNVGGAVSLQPEFVKIVHGQTEVRSFQDFASGTALVFGQHLARQPYSDPATGLTVFGFRLFENGADLVPFFAVACESPARACELLHSFCKRLQDWYGTPTRTGAVPLGVTNSRIEELITNLDRLSPKTAGLVAESLARLRSASPPGNLARIHGDLHLENLIVPKNAEYCYLVDFANSYSPGSPCIDIARLESDIIYRTLPYDMSAEEVGRFESNLWSGNFDALDRLAAGALVMTLRHTLQVLDTPNAAIWLLAGRVLNGLKMIANTWLTVRPYGFGERTSGVVASIRVLAENLAGALDGRVVKILARQSKCKLSGEGFRSIRWLYANRLYDDAFDFARLLSEASTKCIPDQNIVGSLSALSTTSQAASGELLFQAASPRARTPLAKGLKALYQAIRITKEQDGRDLKRAMRLFGLARKFLEESGDSFFTSVALDQMARCQQDSGEADAAKISFRDAIKLKEQSHDTVGLATSIGGLGLLELSSGFYGESRSLFERDLEIATQIGDRRAEIKICNWLGQVAILDTFDVVSSVRYMNRSIELATKLGSEQPGKQISQRYSPALDLAFGYIGLGFAFVMSESLERSADCATQGHLAMDGVGGIAADFAATLLELQTAMILAVEGQQRRALIRTIGALSHLRELSLLDFCDYSVRSIRFYINRNETQIASHLARQAVGPIRSLKLARLHAFIVAAEVIG